jgi:hypothetical protein
MRHLLGRGGLWPAEGSFRVAEVRLLIAEDYVARVTDVNTLLILGSGANPRPLNRRPLAGAGLMAASALVTYGYYESLSGP